MANNKGSVRRMLWSLPITTEICCREMTDTKEVKGKWLSQKLHALNARAMETLTKQAFWKLSGLKFNG